MFVVDVLKGGKIVKKQYILIGFILLLLWPMFAYISAILRLSTKQDFLYTSVNIKVLLSIAFIGLSRRLGGIDILMIPILDNNITFSTLNILLYLFKGIFTTGLVDKIMGNNYTTGIGTAFAEEFLSQPKGVPNAFSPTLLGIIYFTPNIVFTSLLLLFVTLLIFIFLSYNKKKWIISFMLIVQIVMFIRIVVFTGSVSYLTFWIRQIFVFLILITLFDNIKSKKYI
jgi:hypothetical protein